MEPTKSRYNMLGALKVIVSCALTGLAVHLSGWGIALGMLLIVFVHEFSHRLFLTSVCKIKPANCGLFISPFFGLMWAEEEPDKIPEGWKRCGWYLSGCIGNLFLAGLFRIGIAMNFTSALSDPLCILYIVSLFVILTNLIPFPVLDGGRCLMAVFSRGSLSGHFSATSLLMVSAIPIWFRTPWFTGLLVLASICLWKPLVRESAEAGRQLSGRARIGILAAWSAIAGVTVVALYLAWLDEIWCGFC